MQGSDDRSTTNRAAVCLWFDDQAAAAAEFYVATLRDGEIRGRTRYLDPDPSPAGRDGEPMTVEFTVEGIDFVALNGGPAFTMDEAVSIMVFRDTQEELDATWDALLADGGRESRCGWLRDRFGVSWQVLPRNLSELLRGPDGAPSRAANEALLGMVRIDIAELRVAAAGS